MEQQELMRGFDDQRDMRYDVDEELTGKGVLVDEPKSQIILSGNVPYNQLKKQFSVGDQQEFTQGKRNIAEYINNIIGTSNSIKYNTPLTIKEIILRAICQRPYMNTNEERLKHMFNLVGKGGLIRLDVSKSSYADAIEKHKVAMTFENEFVSECVLDEVVDFDDKQPILNNKEKFGEDVYVTLVVDGQQRTISLTELFFTGCIGVDKDGNHRKPYLDLDKLVMEINSNDYLEFSLSGDTVSTKNTGLVLYSDDELNSTKEAKNKKGLSSNFICTHEFGLLPQYKINNDFDALLFVESMIEKYSLELDDETKVKFVYYSSFLYSYMFETDNLFVTTHLKSTKETNEAWFLSSNGLSIPASTEDDIIATFSTRSDGKFINNILNPIQKWLLRFNINGSDVRNRTIRQMIASFSKTSTHKDNKLYMEGKKFKNVAISTFGYGTSKTYNLNNICLSDYSKSQNYVDHYMLNAENVEYAIKKTEKLFLISNKQDFKKYYKWMKYLPQDDLAYLLLFAFSTFIYEKENNAKTHILNSNKSVSSILKYMFIINPISSVIKGEIAAKSKRFSDIAKSFIANGLKFDVDNLANICNHYGIQWETTLPSTLHYDFENTHNNADDARRFKAIYGGDSNNKEQMDHQHDQHNSGCFETLSTTIEVAMPELDELYRKDFTRFIHATYNSSLNKRLLRKDTNNDKSDTNPAVYISKNGLEAKHKNAIISGYGLTNYTDAERKKLLFINNYLSLAVHNIKCLSDEYVKENAIMRDVELDDNDFVSKDDILTKIIKHTNMEDQYPSLYKAIMVDVDCVLYKDNILSIVK